MLAMVLSVISLASFNAMYVPLALEAQIYTDERSSVLMGASRVCGEAGDCWSSLDLRASANATRTAYTARCQQTDTFAR